MSDLLLKLDAHRRRGSKPRCHWLTRGSPHTVAARLSALIQPWGRVSADDKWMPQGFDHTDEAEFHEATRLLDPAKCLQLRDWWFANYRGGLQTAPSFDIASTCMIDMGDGERRGFLLVEAKAHPKELMDEEGGKLLKPSRSPGEARNHDQIGTAIRGANPLLKELTGFDWALSHETRYQMSNRFAWSAKLMEMGYPVALVYLGFLNADDMKHHSKSFAYHAEWKALVKKHSDVIFPSTVWNHPWGRDGKVLVPLIRSSELAFDEPVEAVASIDLAHSALEALTPPVNKD